MADQHGIVAGTVQFAIGLVYQFMAPSSAPLAKVKGVSHLAICGVTRPTLFAGIFSLMSEPENQTRRQADGECGVSETNLHDVNADKHEDWREVDAAHIGKQ